MQPSAALFYGYVLDEEAMHRIALEMEVEHPTADTVWMYLAKKGCGYSDAEIQQFGRSDIEVGAHVEEHRVSNHTFISLSVPDSFVCAKDWGMHEVEAPLLPSVYQTAALRRAMKSIGVENPGDPKWLMKVDFS